MASKSDPPEFRQRVVALVEGASKISEVATERAIRAQVIYMWCRLVRVDTGLDDGVSTRLHSGLESIHSWVRQRILRTPRFYGGRPGSGAVRR